MSDAITTTVTWHDLQTQHQSELQDLQDAYDEIHDAAQEDYGDEFDTPMQQPLPGNPEEVPDEYLNLWVYQRQANQHDEAAKTIQERQHALENLEEEYGSGDFEIKMLSGDETLAIERELRMELQGDTDDVSQRYMQGMRNRLTVDAATVDAPEGIPRDDEGSPVPSEAGQPLAIALFEQVERYNNSGAVDFRPEGLGDVSGPGVSASSEAPMSSGSVSTRSDSDSE